MFQPSNYGLYFYVVSTTPEESKVHINAPEVAYSDYSGLILGRTRIFSVNARFSIRLDENGYISDARCSDTGHPDFTFSVSDNIITLNAGTYASLLFMYFSTDIHHSLTFEVTE